MSDARFDSQRWRELLSDYCNGAIDMAQAEQMASTLGDSREARRMYIAYMDLHASLQWRMSSVVEKGLPDISEDAASRPDASLARTITELLDEELRSESETPVDEVTPRHDVPSEARKSRGGKWDQVLSHGPDSPRASHGWPPWVLASVVLAVLGAGAWIARTSLSPAPAVVRLTDVVDARWAGAAKEIRAGQSLSPGTFELTEGRAFFEFADGAQVGLFAPAKITVVEANQIRLDYGRLVGYCSPAARGFVVETPTARVTDLGTEFAVDVDPSGVAEVHVLTGDVAVQPSSKRRRGLRFELGAGQARRVDAAGAVEVIELAIDRFASIRPLIGRNLIVNGDFEADEPGTVTMDGKRTHIVDVDLTGWRDAAGKGTAIVYDQPNPRARFPLPGRDNVSPDHGRNFYISINPTTVDQTIDVSQLAGPIDAKRVSFELSAYLGGDEVESATVEVFAKFLGAGGKELDTAVVGPVTPEDRDFRMGMWKRAARGRLPFGTRQVRIEIVTKYGGPQEQIPDAYADDLAFVLRVDDGVANGDARREAVE